MADILTQLQTCLDQLATQFYATIGYLSTYHDNSPATPPANDPTSAPALAKIPKNSTAHPVPAGLPPGSSASPPPPQAQPQTPAAEQPADPNLPPAPDSPRIFASRQRELARDLVIKEQQIEYLISVLPGIDSSEKQQEERIRQLEKELREVEARREEKRKELREERKRLERVLGVVEWGIYGNRFGGV